MKNQFLIVETTYPDLESAKKLAEILINEKMAACVQFMPIQSMYSWHEKIQNEEEILVIIKTKKSLYEAIEKVIKKHHSYQIPQIIAIQINQGSESYLKWIESNLEGPK